MNAEGKETSVEVETLDDRLTAWVDLWVEKGVLIPQQFGDRVKQRIDESGGLTHSKDSEVYSRGNGCL